MQEKQIFSVQVDCARNAVLTVESLKRFIDYISAMGYNGMEIYTEDVFEIDGEPMHGYLRGKYSKEELKEVVAYGESKGVTLYPDVECLAHLEHIFLWHDYQKIRDNKNILLVGEEETYKFLDRMFKTLRECFNSDIANINLDEASTLGLGEYLNRNGYTDPHKILLEHLNRVSDIAEKYGFRVKMSSDLFFTLSGAHYYDYDKTEMITQEIIDLVPANCDLCYWDYFGHVEGVKKRLAVHKKFNNPVWFAGSAMNWTTYTPHNMHSIECTPYQMQACVEEGIDKIDIRLWGDDGGECSPFATLPALLYAIEWYKGNHDHESIHNKFYDLFGIKMEDFLLLDKATDYQNKSSDFNSSKVCLFNDPFCGWHDDIIGEEGSHDFEERCAAVAPKLYALKDNKDFGYLFDMAGALCELQSKRFMLGKKTRAAYRADDKQALKELCKLYDENIELVDKFYKRFKFEWRKERKGNGFEVQAIRFGGLKQRLFDCKEMLVSYINGEIDKIGEMDEDIIPIPNVADNHNFKNNKYGKIVTVNSLSHYNFESL